MSMTWSLNIIDGPGRSSRQHDAAKTTWTTDKPSKPGFYWMKVDGMRSRVIEIQDGHHGLYIVQTSLRLADIPEDDRAWAGPLEEPR